MGCSHLTGLGDLSGVIPVWFTAAPGQRSWPVDCARTALVNGERRSRYLLKIEILRCFDGHSHAEDRTALELAGRFVFLAHGIPAVTADAQTIAAQGELAHLRAHRALRHASFIDIELRR